MFFRLLPVILVLFLANPLFAQKTKTDRDEFQNSARSQVTQPVQTAVDRGLIYLTSVQHDDGAFGQRGAYRKNLAVTSLCGMAFLSQGSTPGRGRFGLQVKRAVEAVLKRAQPSGYLLSEESGIGQGPMYGHGFASLFLAEVHGMSNHPRLPGVLRQAVQLIIKSQNREGGWRYYPQPDDADVSVTVCQMVALRAARNAGIAVPRETMDRAVGYLRRCQNSDGGFRYQIQARRESLLPRSAAALTGFYGAGIYRGDEVDQALGFLTRAEDRNQEQRPDYFFYGLYYSAQARWQTGDQVWLDWFPNVRDELLRLQLPDGSWSDSFIGSEYATAVACLVLQTTNDYLPIFQR